MLQSINSGLYMYKGNTGKNVAAFDLDDTIIRTIRGKFPKDEHDWKFLPNRLYMLNKYKNDGYTLAIFTNQKYKGKKLVIALSRINNVITALLEYGINPYVYVATEDNMYRKPNVGMWTFTNISESFYVGDAAGRPQDHSDSDINFAKNIGLKFYTPEEIFPQNEIMIPQTRTMFIFVGMPGSGKTTFYNERLAPVGYIHANKDKLKTQDKVIKVVTNALLTGKSVAVDSTGASAETRRDIIMLALQYQVPTMIIYFVRDGHGWNALREKPVPEIAYSKYYKNLVEPKLGADGVPVVELF